VEEGPTARIIQNPQQPYTKALLACRPILHTKGERLPVVDDFLGTPQEKQPAVRKELSQNDNKQEPSKAMLVVKELSVYFPNQKSWTGKILSETRAVDGVSFEVAKGETLGLVGESGCGKSTLGRAVLRLIEPSAGDVWLNGVHINRLPKENLRTSRRDIQIIFQDPYSSLNPRIRIGDAILEPMEVHGLEGNEAKRKQKVIHLLEKVNLQPDHFNRYPHEFSGGQRQRIGIARALALDPSFIICDESVSALDVSVQAQVLNLLNDLKKEFGFTSIFISHDLGVVHYISDRIMVMNKGKIVELGTADEVFHRPKEAYTKRLIASIPKV